MYDAFARWVDKVLLAPMPNTVVAFNFNLYEGEDSFHVQLIGASRFDSSDEDWRCDEVFTTGLDFHELPHAAIGSDWRSALEAAKLLVEQYVATGARRDALTSAKAVGVGFVDGDVHVVRSSASA
jgi:hypothetical protein